jgi:hypothetical protein
MSHAAVRGGDRGLEFSARRSHHALIDSAIKLLLYETGDEAAPYGAQGERTRRTADVTGTAKKTTDALQTRPLGVLSVQRAGHAGKHHQGIAISIRVITGGSGTGLRSGSGSSAPLRLHVTDSGQHVALQRADGSC